MSKEADRAALAAMLANTTKPVTKIAAAPMDASLSASRVVAAEAKTKVEKKLEARAYTTKRPKRDWEAQRRYDEQHGTVNGYDERIEDALAMRRREAGEY